MCQDETKDSVSVMETFKFTARTIGQSKLQQISPPLPSFRMDVTILTRSVLESVQIRRNKLMQMLRSAGIRRV
jgi:hypothetical protein